MSTLGKIAHMLEHKIEQAYCAVFHDARRRSQRPCSKNAQASMVPDQIICEIHSMGALCFQSFHVGRAFVAGHLLRSSKEALTRSPYHYNACFQALSFILHSNSSSVVFPSLVPLRAGCLDSPIVKVRNG